MTISNRGTTPPIDDELLSAWLDGQVSSAERAAVEAAIAADPAVRAQVADLRATVALLRALPQPVPRRTFILTSAQAAAIRPPRVAWITRLFPAVVAASAVAAVLCLALVFGDLATGGFSTKTQTTTARPATGSVPDAPATPITAAAAIHAVPAATTAAAALPAGTTAAASAASAGISAPAAAVANIPAPASAGVASSASARSQGAPAVGTAGIALTATGGAGVAAPPLTPTVGSFAASTSALSVTPTVVANLLPTPAALRAAPPAGAVVTNETHRVPVALVRVGEILLALLAVAGITLTILSRRAKTRRG